VWQLPSEKVCRHWGTRLNIVIIGFAHGHIPHFAISRSRASFMLGLADVKHARVVIRSDRIFQLLGGSNDFTGLLQGGVDLGL